MLVVVMRLITALAAAAMLGVTTPAAARVDRGGFDAVLAATLERSWSWQATSSCGDDAGEGRRVVTIRTAAPVAVGKNGGTIAVVGTLELGGLVETWETRGGSCVQRAQSCPTSRKKITGSVRLHVRGDVVSLSNLRYRVVGRSGCAPEIAAVRAALRNEPRLERVVVRDRERKLRNPRIPRVTVRASADPSAQLGGDVTGTVNAGVDWTLTLTRR